MNKFMLVFHSAATDESAFQDLSPEAIQAEIQKWNQWIGGIAAQGKLAGTDALYPTGRTIRGASRVVTDGPYTEGKEIVGGYMLLSAASLEEAAEMAKGCPIFDTNGTVEVRPIQVFE